MIEHLTNYWVACAMTVVCLCIIAESLVTSRRERRERRECENRSITLINDEVRPLLGAPSLYEEWRRDCLACVFDGKDLDWLANKWRGRVPKRPAEYVSPSEARKNSPAQWAKDHASHHRLCLDCSPQTTMEWYKRDAAAFARAYYSHPMFRGAVRIPNIDIEALEPSDTLIAENDCDLLFELVKLRMQAICEPERTRGWMYRGVDITDLLRERGSNSELLRKVKARAA